MKRITTSAQREIVPEQQVLEFRSHNQEESFEV